MLQTDLQRFAGDKTERATPERRREAKREGRTPRSAELTSAVGLFAVLLGLRWFGAQIWSTWQTDMSQSLSSASGGSFSEQSIIGLCTRELWLFVKLLTPLVGLALLFGVLSAFSQVGPTFLPKLLLPDFKRIQPIHGIKRLWSAHTFVELLKSVLKLTLIGTVTYMSIQSMAPHLLDLSGYDIHSLPATVGQMVFQIGIQIAVLMLGLALLDFIFQRYDFERSIRMSKQEIKDEMKRHDGNPEVKAKIRQRGRALAFRRMMQSVPKADVVVTNPTHFAVAIQYDASTMKAPVVVAKGQDLTARRIRERAVEAGVPLVEDRPLARGLYHAVEIGDPVPPDLYQAVAQVLAYVYRMN